MRFSFDPIYDSVSVSTVLSILVIGLLIAVTPATAIPGRRRILLMLRGIAAVTILLVMLRPGFVRTDNRPAAATLAIAVDTSRSMTLASGDRGSGGLGASGTGVAKTRWDQEQQVLAEVAKQIGQLDDNLNVTLYQYDQSARTVGAVPANGFKDLVSQSFQVKPDGNLTDLSAPLRAAMTTSRSSPLAGIALIGDGTQTVVSQDDIAGDRVQADPVAGAKLLGAMGVPLWTVAVGPADEGVRLQDVAVSALPETYRMFTGNETEISFEVQSQGFAGATLPISLVWISAEGKRVTAATRSIVAAANEDSQSMRLPVIAPEPGRYRLVVQAESRPGEIDDSNNRQLAFVEVRSGGGQVLYVEGTPRLEQTFLRRALRRFPDLELSYRWIPRDTVGRWPIDMADDLQSGRYDVVILGDLHSAALGEKQLADLAESVGSGTALVTLGGEHAYGPGGYADSPLAGVLPIRMDGSTVQPPGGRPAGRSEPDAAGRSGARSSGGQFNESVSLRVAMPHPITNIAMDQTDWSTVAPMPGANRWDGIRTAPGVQVLLESSDGQPMMVVGEYGKGRVASIAFDSTWAWWRSGDSEFHRRFWRQLMLWVLSREETDETEIEIEMTHRRFLASGGSNGGSEFVATLNQFGQSGDDAQTPSTTSLNATLILESGETMAIATEQSRRGELSRQVVQAKGQIPSDIPPGIHTLRVQTTGRSAEMSNEMPFQVIDDTRELAAGVADHSLLSRLAALTAESGGESFRLDQVDELVAQILAQRRRAERVVIEKLRLGDDPVSAWILFVMFAGSLSTEWFLRRKWGLA
ncbi:Uncharacterized membrane protein [Neorhodopirellula lusitana]|uniref:Uncharacterized membrane protein n=1 Tax=Neorhodopirellula lusitana TaxID=445327 RepID=A0ABY1QQX8_9BACT|nr:hypothetical protein [Neorhodopirellula lusitana]SMP78436.1 Uncharacterized membrane protein [Neorhodopirellula lusitana]